MSNNTNSAPMNITGMTNELIKKPPLKKRHDKSSEKYFLIILFIYMCVVYYVYTYEFIWKNITVIIVWCLLATMFTIPGDDDTKRKRYCLLCNAFKPDRCHHCSICNKCILNMDHHCPWVNNCIGFYNRKYFLQLVFYVVVTTWFINISMASEIIDTLKKIYYNELIKKELLKTLLILVTYAINCTLSVLITMFLKFHFDLLKIKSTTIEILDKNHAEINKRNWLDVFGTTKLGWFLPLRSEDTRPLGDGLLWPLPELYATNNLSTSSSNLELCKNKKAVSSLSGGTFTGVSIQNYINKGIIGKNKDRDIKVNITEKIDKAHSEPSIKKDLEEIKETKNVPKTKKENTKKNKIITKSENNNNNKFFVNNALDSKNSLESNKSETNPSQSMKTDEFTTTTQSTKKSGKNLLDAMLNARTEIRDMVKNKTQKLPTKKKSNIITKKPEIAKKEF